MSKTKKEKKASVRKNILEIVPIRGISERDIITWMMEVTWICSRYRQRI